MSSKIHEKTWAMVLLPLFHLATSVTSKNAAKELKIMISLSIASGKGTLLYLISWPMLSFPLLS